MKKRFELLRNIKTKGIDNTNNNLINQNINDIRVNKQEIDTLRNDLGDLGNNVNQNANDIINLNTKAQEQETQINSLESNLNTNYYAKNEIDTQQQAQNTKIEANTNDVNTLKTNVEGINNKFNDYFNKQETKDYVANNTMLLFEVQKDNSFSVEGNLIKTNYLGSITQTGYYKSLSYTYNYQDLPKGVNGNGSGLLVHINFTNDRALQLWYARENSQNYYQRHKIGPSETSWTPWTKFSGVVES